MEERTRAEKGINAAMLTIFEMRGYGPEVERLEMKKRSLDDAVANGIDQCLKALRLGCLSLGCLCCS